MSSLSDQLSSFKKKVKSAPVLQRHVVNQAAGVGQKRESNETSTQSPKRKKTAVAIAQAAAAASAASNAPNRHLNTMIMDASEYIKRADKPVSFDDIASYLSTDIDSLLPRLLKIDRIQINMAQKTAQYVSVYGIYSKEDLLTFLRRQDTYQGIPVNKLKDGWNGCLAAIEELEKEQLVIVTRTKKENIPRFVWANTGGPLGGIDEEFISIWSQIKVPDAADLPAKLLEAGLKPTSVDPATIKSNKKSTGERKQKKPRRGKITNTHLGGLLKDFGM